MHKQYGPIFFNLHKSIVTKPHWNKFLRKAGKNSSALGTNLIVTAFISFEVKIEVSEG